MVCVVKLYLIKLMDFCLKCLFYNLNINELLMVVKWSWEWCIFFIFFWIYGIVVIFRFERDLVGVGWY